MLCSVESSRYPHYIIKDGAEFKDLGEDYLSVLNSKSRYQYLLREAKVIGYKLVPEAV